MKIGITGGNGFVGRHLINYLNLKDNVIVDSFNGNMFSDTADLKSFVSRNDVIVHLAGVNRHESESELYNLNLRLMESLISACEITRSKPIILFSSSTQEDLENLYGKSKKEAGSLLVDWGKKQETRVVNMVIPNVFGPFGRPRYNSVVATFCHLLANQEQPTILQDGDLKLVYINELVEDIYKLIFSNQSGKVFINHRHELKVSTLLEKLEVIKKSYMNENSFPNLENTTDLALFNTFRCYIPNDHYPVKFKNNIDNRGNFVEIARTNTSGQTSYSTTLPGITRGNHFHTRKAERFAVIKGKASIKLRKVDSEEIIEYILNGSEPAYVDMPIWCTHNITNIGDEELVTIFWINEPYDANDHDTYMLPVTSH
jgi:UDP-2-acetamido-2,6-beta-L-arabino-hexul-4-ose reductase